jgi:hypothetical protein
VSVDLVEFIRARLGEWEATAREFLDSYDSDPKWRGWRVAYGELVTVGGKVVIEVEAGLSTDLLSLIALGQPWRVLAEVEALRRIVDLHEIDHECSSWDSMMQDFNNCRWVLREEDCTTVRLVGFIWRDHPSFDPAWAPEEVRT